MNSKYNGWCSNCKKRINIGDKIVKHPVTSKWVHENCRQAKSNSDLSGRNILESAIVDGLEMESLKVRQIVDEAITSGSFSTDFVPSKYQQDIFDFIQNGTGNAVVEAVAGSGKTSTIVKALGIVPEGFSVVMLAFNKHIAKELKAKAPSHVHVSTIHSLGLQIVRKLADFKGTIDNDKVGGICDEFWPIDKKSCPEGSDRKKNRLRRYHMRRIVSLAKATLVDVESSYDLDQMLDKFGIDWDDQIPVVLEKLPYVMKKCLENIETIDYDDMIWLPVVHKRLRIHFDKFYYIFVDEAQDLNKSQIEFVKLLAYPESRIICVGDRKQSLYGFRGADTDAIPNLIEMLDAKVLPLSITYRCPKTHVVEAKKIVPQIEASDTAKEGKIGDKGYIQFLTEVEAGDMVICRMNAPLIKPAFETIKAGKKAIIRGKDIGATLINFVERFQAETLSDLQISMSEFTDKEYQRLIDKGKELEAETAMDRLETITVVANECKTVVELINKLEMLYSDSNTGVVFSSVHRAKGLEADRVYILAPELMPHKKAKQDWEKVQEDNCLYVALTRSKDELYFVEGVKQYA